MGSSLDFRIVDADGDGIISKAEMAAALEANRAAKEVNVSSVVEMTYLTKPHVLQISSTVDASIPPDVSLSMFLFQTALEGTWHEEFSKWLQPEALDAMASKTIPGLALALNDVSRMLVPL